MIEAPTHLQHPSIVIDKIIARYGLDLVFTYSRYQVAEPGCQEAAPRTGALRVGAKDVTSMWLKNQFAELGPREEMAWHSWVEYNGVGCHIPMIDFTDRPNQSVLSKLERRLVAEIGFDCRFILFETGRSFHGYSLELVPRHSWLEYLDQLVVFDSNEHSPVIDTRWVGYARARGFAALRWSHNTNRYRAMPHLAT